MSGPRRVEIPASKTDLHVLLDTVLQAPAIKGAVSDILGQAVWIVNVRTTDDQVKFADAITRMLDDLSQE